MPVFGNCLEVLQFQQMAGTEHVPEIADPHRTLRRRGLGIGILVVERMVTIGPQHDRAGLVEHHLRVDDAHQVDHPQVLALVPRAVVVDRAGLLVGDRAGEDGAARGAAELVVGHPQPRLLGRGEAPQAVCPLLQAAGVGHVVEQLVGRTVDVIVDGAIGSEHLVVRVDRPHHLHDDRRGLLPRRRLDADDPVDRFGGASVGGDVIKRGQRHWNCSPLR